MRIAITGTTSGLGKALVQALQHAYYNPEIIELNRPTIDLERSTAQIIDKAGDFDLFINNAHSTFQQTELLYDLFEAHKDRKCDIITVGSVSADGDRKEVNRYAIEKASIDKATAQLQMIESECRVSVIKPGRMKTPMTDHRDEFYRMDPEEVADTIILMFQLPRSLIIKTITIDVHNSNRKIK